MPITKRALATQCSDGMINSTIGELKKHLNTLIETYGELRKAASEADSCTLYWCTVVTGTEIARSSMKLMNRSILAIMKTTRTFLRCVPVKMISFLKTLENIGSFFKILKKLY